MAAPVQNATPATAGTVKLTADLVSRMVMVKSFSENEQRINSIDFTADGQTMITSSDDDSIVMYNCNLGTKTRAVNSKKYGVDLIRFTHNHNTGIHCSTKVDDTIRYLSLHDNKYIRYFPGHTKKVLTLCMSPQDDMFLSGSEDKTIRLWDLKSPNCQGVMQVTSRAVAAFDPDGLIFGAGVNSQSVKLYDLRSFDKGPFMTWQLEQEPNCDWTGMKFSPDGKHILITTDGEVMRVIDAFSGTQKHVLRGHVNARRQPLEAAFTPGFAIRALRHGQKNADIQTDHTGLIQQVAFNPRFFIMATACTKLNLWIPPDDA
ncbi:unnamed protein product, partial [Mesorhabditis belari]|uniref:WD repeat-containing protein 82 n=1 Tax=Mesorhabditis belari TaxID=2138241 RepID=A0AAF3J3J8_9BILA